MLTIPSSTFENFCNTIKTIQCRATLSWIVHTRSDICVHTKTKSQLGFIVILCDKYENASLVHYASYKSRETYAFADAYDTAYCIKRDLELLFQRRIPLKMFTDPKRLFDVITKCSQTQERRIMIDLQTVRDAYSSQEISDVGFVRGSSNPADGMTNTGQCSDLEHLLCTGKANFLWSNGYCGRKSQLNNQNTC